MRVAIFATRGTAVPEFSAYIPQNTSEILTSGAGAVGLALRAYAQKYRLPLRVFTPERRPSGRFDYAGRDTRMIEAAEQVFLFLGNDSRSASRILRECAKRGVCCCVVTSRD